MIHEAGNLHQATLEDLIEAYEAAHGQHAELDITEFLPSSDRPLYRDARRELIRVDLELRWPTPQRWTLADYTRLFPDLLHDRESLQEIAFEEYRLRLLAGEEPNPADYEQKYGLTTSTWPRAAAPVDLGSAEKPPSNGKHGRGAPALPVELLPQQILQQQRSLFLDFNSASHQRDSWQSSRRGDVAQALLMENLHQSDSEAVFLLTQAMTALPEVGTKFLDFQLIAELGHGGFGRVYLARQGDLANRLVALKITIDLLGEEQKLAQLQHTNVVPIYSVWQAGPLQAVCMPYFGATTLADVVQRLHQEPSIPSWGKSLVSAVRARKQTFLDQVQPAAKKDVAATEDDVPLALSMLEKITYVDAVLWLAEQLTEGLIHAHERGILHRDLKPANILLTDEGRPMLLDFNLSEDTKFHDGFGNLQVGGTLPYMSPEHLDAFRGGKRPIDARSDLYALGVILFELLTGRLPFVTKSGSPSEAVPPMIAERMHEPPRLRRCNRAISPAVESIVRHCLEPDPSRRYQSAHDLREDLQRQRQHRPLRFAPEPSLRERAYKWMQRHPRLTSPASLGAITALVLALCLAPAGWRAFEKWQQDVAETKRAEEDSLEARKQKQEADQRAETADRRNKALYYYQGFKKHLDASSARGLLETVNIVQTLPEAWPSEEKNLVKAMEQCREALSLYHVMEQPDWEEQPLVCDLPREWHSHLRNEVVGLLYALGQAEQVRYVRWHDISRQHSPMCLVLAMQPNGLDVWWTWQAVQQARLLDALTYNDRACDCFANVPLCQPLLMQQAELRELQGRRAEARRLFDQAQALPLRDGTEDNYWTASVLVADGRYADALPLLKEATQEFPGHFGAWHLLALCRHHEKQLRKAIFCYNTCAALSSKCVWVCYLRGLAHFQLGDALLAECDFDSVVKERPELASAYIKRAMAREELAKHKPAYFMKAIGDLSEAIQLEPETPELFYLRAQLRAKVRDFEGAALDRRHVLEARPSHAEGWIYRGMVQSADDPKKALADFEKALAFDPQDILALFSKARVLAFDFNRDKEAVRILDQVLTLDKNHTEARVLRGLLLAELRQRERAVKDAELAVYGNAEMGIQGDESPARHYQAAWIYALTSRYSSLDRKRAIEHLAYALRHGYAVDRYKKDAKLSPLRNLQAFQDLDRGLKLLGYGDIPRMRP